MPLKAISHEARMKVERRKVLDKEYNLNPRSRGVLREVDRLRHNSRYIRFRHWLIRSRPLCEECERLGKVEVSRHVHHKRGLYLHPEDLCDSTKCSCLCIACHNRLEGVTE